MLSAVNNLSFRSEQIKKEAKHIQNNDNKKMSTTSKVLVGATAAAAIAIAGVAIKNKAASNALKKTAEELGIDVKLLKVLRENGIKTNKVETATYEHCTNFLSNSINGEKGIFRMALMSPQETLSSLSEISEENVKLPKNAFGIITRKEDGSLLSQALLISEKIDSSLSKVVGEAWEQGKTFVEEFLV